MCACVHVYEWERRECGFVYNVYEREYMRGVSLCVIEHVCVSLRVGGSVSMAKVSVSVCMHPGHMAEMQTRPSGMHPCLQSRRTESGGLRAT